MKIEERHIKEAEKASELYRLANLPGPASERWHEYYKLSHAQVVSALRSSDYLRDLAKSLRIGGSHTAVFRQLLAPPVSQDQFDLLCKDWKKTFENSNTPLPDEVATTVADIIGERLDNSLAPWVRAGRSARPREVTTLVRVAATLMAVQKDATARRNGLAAAQEGAVIDLLKLKGWTQLSGGEIDERGQVATKNFLHKARFTTATTAAQEVDIACGLKKSRVLAMECKVTNDKTNSVKRVNDVIKKASAWKTQYGKFLTTAALLQGVIAPKDVQRLTDNDIEVFWSHDLEALSKWLDENS